jgi:hypothetical protein
VFCEASTASTCVFTNSAALYLFQLHCKRISLAQKCSLRTCPRFGKRSVDALWSFQASERLYPPSTRARTYEPQLSGGCSCPHLAHPPQVPYPSLLQQAEQHIPSPQSLLQSPFLQPLVLQPPASAEYAMKETPMTVTMIQAILWSFVIRSPLVLLLPRTLKRPYMY